MLLLVTMLTDTVWDINRFWQYVSQLISVVFMESWEALQRIYRDHVITPIYNLRDIVVVRHNWSEHETLTSNVSLEISLTADPLMINSWRDSVVLSSLSRLKSPVWLVHEAKQTREKSDLVV